MTRRINDERIAEILRLHGEGQPQHLSSVRVGVSQGTVSLRCVRLLRCPMVGVRAA
jgi:hypothetical protein